MAVFEVHLRRKGIMKLIQEAECSEGSFMKHGGQEKYLRGRVLKRIIETAECLGDHSRIEYY